MILKIMKMNATFGDDIIQGRVWIYFKVRDRKLMSLKLDLELVQVMKIKTFNLTLLFSHFPLFFFIMIREVKPNDFSFNR